MSITNTPFGCIGSTPEPNAAQSGLSIRQTDLAPAVIITEMSVLFSTSVAKAGTAATTRGLKMLFLITLFIKYLSICSVNS